VPDLKRLQNRVHRDEDSPGPRCAEHRSDRLGLFAEIDRDAILSVDTGAHETASSALDLRRELTVADATFAVTQRGSVRASQR
jgi:hypothetical protein